MAHPKGVLIERLQKEGRQPRFDTRASGPAHEPVFDAEVTLDGEVLGSGRGPNKRTAERLAAEEALAALDDVVVDELDEASDDVAERAGAADAPGDAPADADDEDEDEDEGAFEGPWPVFDDVLAAVLRIAHERVDGARTDDDAREAIQEFALTLYKDVLQDLGDVVELDD